MNCQQILPIIVVRVIRPSTIDVARIPGRPITSDLFSCSIECWSLSNEMFMNGVESKGVELLPSSIVNILKVC